MSLIDTGLGNSSEIGALLRGSSSGGWLRSAASFFISSMVRRSPCWRCRAAIAVRTFSSSVAAYWLVESSSTAWRYSKSARSRLPASANFLPTSKWACEALIFARMSAAR